MFKAGGNHKESADSKALSMSPRELRLPEGANPGPAGVPSRTLFPMVVTGLAIRLILVGFMYPGVLQRSDLSHSAPARYLYRVQRFVILHKYKYARLLRALRRSVA
jgi:hypothetical protein